MKKVAIIGGGPSSLILAAHLRSDIYDISIYEKNMGVGRKFLVAGDGGLNLSYNAPTDELISKYYPQEFMAPYIRNFNNADLRLWLESIDIPTFIGSSQRIFPNLDLKPIEVLNKMVKAVEDNGCAINFGYLWKGINEEGELIFNNDKIVKSDYIIFALGGSSWKVTGSDGEWADIFKRLGIGIAPFQAVNCAFEVNWTKNFITTHKGKPLKNISVTFNENTYLGEMVITKFGLEGNALYAHSREIQNALKSNGEAVIYVDLKPSMSFDQIKAKLILSKESKITDTLKKDLNLERPSIGLLKHFSNKETFFDPDLLAETIKAVPVTIGRSDDIDKAISTIGGVELSEVYENLELKKIPNSFVIGEMLDWFAPTGGYLLQGCFSMGYSLAKYLNELNPE